MCTALKFKTNDTYFGRTLDLDCSYGEQVCIVPRNFPIMLREKEELTNHYAMIGIAIIVDNTPLFYDATNEYGVSMAGLNFPGNAYYNDLLEDKDNICQFEFIPWILGQCKNINEVRILLSKINIINTPFNERFPVSPLHWMISDSTESIVVESMKDGLHIYDNPVEVMTNNPPFNYQLFNLNNYRSLQDNNGKNTFLNNMELNEYCQGLGSLGLPGDVSSMSRFIRCVFNKEHSVCDLDEQSSVTQFFHILNSVEMVKGTCKVPNGHYDITVYTSCINSTKGLYYYTTYTNHQINCIDMNKINLDGNQVLSYPLLNTEQINYQN